MSLADDEKWILASNLKNLEKDTLDRIKKGEVADAEKAATEGDFGAYFSLLTGKNTDLVKPHAISDEHYIAAYVYQLKRVLDRSGCHNVASILDVGCGPGMLTKELSTIYPDSRIMGIDISESGIAYACKTYPRCRFKVVSVDESMNLNEKFDLIHAREFYPFTRTGDFEFHRMYIETLGKHLNEHGALVLYLLPTSKSIAKNASALTPALEKIGMTPLRRIPMAHSRIPIWAPLPVARFISLIVRKFLGRPTPCFYLSIKINAK
jgi:SAM-dependent methyltransferase